MIAPLFGGCACGSIRYVCARAPVAMLNCHCRDCQRSSGAPFASGFIVLAAVVSQLAASAPIVAPLYSRVAKLLQNSCPFASPPWTVSPNFSRCWTSGHLVHNRGFALARKFLIISSPPRPPNNRFERSQGSVFGEARRGSMIWIDLLRSAPAPPRVAQPHR
jgi:hypothetical protein